MKREEYLAELVKQAEIAIKVLDDFHKEFKKQPQQALRWADGVFHAAAVVELNNTLIQSVNKGNTRSSIVAWLRREISDMAACPENSSNQSGNLLSRLRMSVHADALRALLNGDVGAGVLEGFDGEVANEASQA